MNKTPVIGITMGDPCGIGPEIIMSALDDKLIYRLCTPVVVGDPGVLSHYNRKNINIKEINAPEGAQNRPGHINVIPVSRLEKKDYLPANPTEGTAKAMAEYIIHATRLSLEGRLNAIVTCPISKVLLKQAGYPFEGHTQFISSLTDSDQYVMMLAGGRLRVSLVTIHRAIKEVPAILTRESILRTIIITARALELDFNIPNPEVAVSALNPHGGEDGLMGDEETRIIKPAIEMAKAQGYHASGPYPADTIFHKALTGQFDAVIAMYHDQGLIPVKLLHFSDAVNITLGLPIIRTSVDHGTAYDIAGKGIASDKSLKSAIFMAVEMIKNRKKNLLQG
jgi:4-hydroxythreonine-4-phosphate dehydrogenase